MTYEQYMTDEYDSQFRSVKELKWDPWVGKNYHKTGIFVVGMSTDQRDGDWTQYIKPPKTPRDSSRILVTWNNSEELFHYDKDGRSFQKMAHIFTDEAGWNRGVGAYAAFWQSVAFTNFFQVVVEGMGAWPENKEIQDSKRAFYRACEIIRPKLVLFWENDISFLWAGHRSCQRKIGRVTPQIIEPEYLAYYPPIVGIGHPARMNQSDCRDFLRSERVSKKPIRNLLNHLKQSPH